MTIVQHPSAAGAEPNKRHARSGWLQSLDEVRVQGGLRGVMIYETADGGVGYESTPGVSASHAHGLLIAALHAMEAED